MAIQLKKTISLICKETISTRELPITKVILIFDIQTHGSNLT